MANYKVVFVGDASGGGGVLSWCVEMGEILLWFWGRTGGGEISLLPLRVSPWLGNRIIDDLFVS